MQIPTWKKWLSYFQEIHLESAPSEINPHLYVSLKNGRLQMSTANAIYSHADLYLNFKLAFQKLNWLQFSGKNVLILGLGLGSIVYILEKIFEKSDLSFTAVEIDDQVIHLASKYLLPDIQSPIEFICADAMTFSMVSEQQYDLICMDIFLDDFVPHKFETRAFMQQLEMLLSPNGLLMYNRLAQTKADIQKNEKLLKNIFRPVFPQGGFLPVKDNWMMVSQCELFEGAKPASARNK